ncbi:TonB-dependent siderophore receptor [Erythrobacter sp. W302b]|uniref:TonB-dependent siderophore receptor n=1 Tax=Erythrobacter sp. W302b TaxID=3389874 RepID=UPI00396AF050
MKAYRPATSVFAIAIASAACLPQAAMAQSSDEEQATTETRADQGKTAEGILVVGKRESGYTSDTQSGATFGEQSIFDTPFSVTTIPQEVLLDQQVRALGDIARNDPSTTVSTPPGFNDTVNLRGFNLDNSTSYRREGLIFQNQVQSPFENKAAVEIIKGPASVRYGFTPPGGVINYVLKRPTDTPYRFVQAFGDSFGSVGVHADVGGRFSDTVGYRINAVAAQEATFVEGVAGPRYMISALFEWRPTDRLTIDVEGEYQYRELEQQANLSIGDFADDVTPQQRRALIESFDRTTFLGQEWGTYPTSNFVGSIGARYEISEKWTVQARAQQMRLERDQQAAGIAFGTLQANGDFEQDIFFDADQVRDPFSAEIFVTGQFDTLGITHDIAFGGAISRNPLRFSLGGDCCLVAGASNIFNPVALPRPPVNETPDVDAIRFNQDALFVSDLITITDEFKLFGALRWSRQENLDRFNDAETLETTYEDNDFVPNVGVLYTPTERLTFYASFAEGVTQGEQIPIEAANFGTEAFLPPAATSQIEAGVKAEIFTGAILTAAYFDISQPLATFDADDIFGYLGDQVHRGLEVTLNGEVAPGLRLIAGGLYLDAQIDNPNDPVLDGKRPSGVPEYQINLFADYEVAAVPGLALNGGVFLTGERFADELNTFTIDGYVRVDLGVRYAFDLGDQRLTARVNVRNVTDENFVEGTAFGSFLFGAPRAAFFSLAAEF